MIELQSITLVYKQNHEQKEILRNISLVFPDTGMVFLVSKNREECLSLLNIIGGIEQSFEGQMNVNGEKTSHFHPNQWSDYRNKKVGFIFQTPMLFYSLTVKQNLSIPLNLQGEKEKSDERISEVLKELGLEGFENKLLSSCSKEEIQKISLAMSLVKKPSILIIEDSFSSLESNAREKMLILLQEEAKKRLVIISSENKEQAEKYGDQIVELSNGEVLENYIIIPGQAKKEKNLPDRDSRCSFKSFFKSEMKHSLLAFKSFRFLLTLILAFLSISSLGFFFSLPYQKDGSYIARSIEKSSFDALPLSPKKGDVAAWKREEIEAFNKEMNVHAQGLLSYEKLRNSYWLGASSDFNAGSKAMQNFFYGPSAPFIALTSLSDLPSSYTLLAGALPSNSNEVVLTDYQFEFFHNFGYKYQDENGETITYLGTKELNNPEKLIGNKLVSVGYKDLTITGILDTPFELQHYVPYIHYLQSETTEEPSQEILSLASELRLKTSNQHGFENILFVHQDFIQEIIDLIPSYEFLEGIKGLFTSSEVQLSSFSTTGIYKESKEDDIAFFTNQSFKDDSIVLNLDSYVNDMISDGLISNESVSFNIPKEYLYNASQDKTLNQKPQDFFRSLGDYGLDYVSQKYWEDAFDNNKSNIQSFVISYYQSQMKEVPSAIPDEDKEKIFHYFLNIQNDTEGRTGYLKNHDAQSWINEAHSLSTKLLTHFVNLYSDSYFRFKDYKIVEKTINGKETDYPLKAVGFTLRKIPLVSSSIEEKISKDYGRYYGEAILPIPKDLGTLKKIVQYNLESSNNQDFLFDSQRGSFWSNLVNVNNNLINTSYIYLGLSIGFFLTAVIVTFFFFSHWVDEKRRKISILKILGVKDETLDAIFVAQSFLFALASFLLSIPLLYIHVAIVNAINGISNNPQFLSVMPGLDEVCIIFAFSLTFAIVIYLVFSIKTHNISLKKAVKLFEEVQ